MDIKKIQKLKLEFDKERGFDKKNSSNVFVHLIEELGEVGRYINFDEAYKDIKLGNSPNINRQEFSREIAQVFMLLLQLANKYGIDLSESFKKELAVARKRFKKK